VNDRIACDAPAGDDAQDEQRSLSNHLEMIQGFLRKRIVGLEHQKNALCHRYPLLELLVLRILSVHDDGNCDAH
jgi:hypothetical protein